MKRLAMVTALALLASGAAPAQVPAEPAWTNQDREIKTTFVRLAPGAPGVLYEPSAPGPKSRIAVFAMHSSADYTTHSVCSQLAKRGYRVLCANNSTSKSGVSEDGVLDRVLLEAKAGIAWLQTVPGVERVVLFGHSGGATVMTAYQMIAEGGVKSCRGPTKLHQCPDNLAGLPAADGVVLADANWGLSMMVLFSIDPAVIDESSGLKLDAALDLFNPQNGFVATGSDYSPAFVTRFQAAVARRSTALIARAQERLKLIEAGKGLYADDEPFDVPGAVLLGSNNKLFTQDVRLLSRSRKPWPLVRADGTAVTGIIHSVRVPSNTENLSRFMMRGALKTSVRNFLSNYAIRVTPDFGYGEDSAIRGVDWRSNYSNNPGNVEGIRAPLLALGMTGGWEALAAETIYEHAASPDKSLTFIEGATHLFTPCKQCVGQFGDTLETTYDFVDRWLSEPGRF